MKRGGIMSTSKSIEMLKNRSTPKRYIRTVSTIGVDGQLTLLRSKVAVIGAGRLGGTVVELLAKIGVGYIRVIDGECFKANNCDRHFLNNYKNIGRNKAEAVVEHIACINSDIAVQAVPVTLDKENAGEVLNGVDVIVDALDHVSSRLLAAWTAREFNIPLVHASIDGWTGQVMTIYPDDIGLDSLYAKETGRGAQIRLDNRAATSALAAALEVQEVIKILTGKGETIRNRLLFFDIECGIFEFLPLVTKREVFTRSAEHEERCYKVQVK